MPEMSYELFVRSAFSFSLGKSIGRYGDPASLADADHFRHDNIVGVKIGTGYAMEIFINYLLNNKGFDGEEYERIESFPGRVLAASSLTEISELIDEFRSSVINRYFEVEEGRFLLR